MSDRTSAAGVLVLGGTGFVGSRICAGLVAEGHPVIVPTRSDVGAARLRSALPADSRLADRRVQTFAGTGLTDAEADTITAQATADGVHIEKVIVSLGGWWKAEPLLSISADTFVDLLDSHLVAHFRALRCWVPRVRGTDPVVLLMNGRAAEAPMSFSGPISVAGAAQRMLLEVVRDEEKARAVRIHELCLLDPVAGDDRNDFTESDAITPDQLHEAVRQVLWSPGLAVGVFRVASR